MEKKPVRFAGVLAVISDADCATHECAYMTIIFSILTEKEEGFGGIVREKTKITSSSSS